MVNLKPKTFEMDVMLREPKKPIQKNLVGNSYGRVRVLKFLGVDKSGKSCYECLCSCKNSFMVRGDSLTRKRKPTRSCGCLLAEYRKKWSHDLTGKIFGRLTVVCATNIRTLSKGIVWKCRCSCGKECYVRRDSLKTGNTKSCGCYDVERRVLGNFKHGLCYTREYKNDNAKKYRIELYDGYVKGLVLRRTGLKKHFEVPSNLMHEYRSNLRVKRGVQELEKYINSLNVEAL